jgi:transcriptional regulator with XRE-family HTH domain
MTDFRKSMGEVLRAERIARDLTLRDVSKSAYIALGFLSEIERGKKELSSGVLASICASLDVTVPDTLERIANHMRVSA